MRKLKTFVMLAAFSIGTLGLGSTLFVASASAVTAKDCVSGKITKQTTTDSDGTKHTINVCEPLGDSCKSANGCLKDSKLVGDIRAIVNALAAGVGVVVVGTIIVAGVQYIIAGDNPSGVEQAKKRIMNGLMALAAFFLTYAFLQWIIPGGIF